MTTQTNSADEFITADVLIIGSGMAGFMAAARASELVENVVLVTKERKVGAGGATLLAIYPFSSCVADSRSVRDLGFPGNPDDSPEIFFKDIVQAGRYLGNQQQIEVFVQEIPRILKWLTTLGFRWNYSRLDQSGGHSYPRDCYGIRYHGLEFKRTMRKILKERKNINVMTDVLTVDLLANNGRVVGVTGLDLRRGRFLAIRAKSTIIATGGVQNIYPRVSTGKGLTGDGQAMAFRMGAEMINPEFVMFGPTVIWPPEVGQLTKGALLQLVRPHHWLLNAQGERFMEKRDPERKEASRLTLRGIVSEVQQGRGSEHGGVYCSIQHLSEERLKQLATRTNYTNWKDPSTRFDFSPVIKTMHEKTFVEIGILCHYFLGGLWIDPHCKTTLPGLFAAGECTGSLHGAARLGGMALSQCLVEGTRAGTYAANEVADQSSFPRLNDLQVESSRSRVMELLERENGINPIELRRKIQLLAIEKVGVIRDAQNLQEMITEIERIKKNELQRLYVTTQTQIYNKEWVEAIQVQNILLNLDIITRAALYRTESRGPHYRSDFPQENQNWQVNIIVRQKGGPSSVMEVIKRSPVTTQEILNNSRVE